MSLQKQYLKSKPVCKVRFKLNKADADGASSAVLVGDFDGWSPEGVAMRKLKDGSFSAQLDLESGRKYRFRYLLDGAIWTNDPDADAYEFCSFADDHNFIVSC